MNGIVVVLVLLMSVAIGVFLGYVGVGYYLKYKAKKLIDNAVSVIQGKKENKMDLDGKIIDVSRFKLRDDKGKDIIIDLHDYKGK